MKQKFLLLFVLPFVVYACSSSNSTKAPIADSYTPTPIETITPTATLTPSPTNTPRPQPELTYIITLSESAKNTLHVKLNARNIASEKWVLTFWTNAGNWHDWTNPANNISNLAIMSENGQSISSQWGDDGISWTGKHGLSINNTGGSSLLIEYDVKLGFLDENFHGDRQQFMGGYLTESFGFAEPEFIFLAPNDIERTNYKMKVIFDLPDGWQTVTHWTKTSENEYEVNTKIGIGGYSSIEFANGAIAFGEIYKEEHSIGDTRVSVGVLGYPESDSKKLAELTVKNFEYYTTLLGSTPTTGYIMIFIPPTVDGKYVNPYNENIGGCFTRIYVNNMWNSSELWWINISHPMFHNWTAYLDGEFWYGEGFTSYYELKALQAVGINDESAVNAELNRRFRRYQQEILGTTNDYPLQNASVIYQSNHAFPYDFITYKKGSLFAYLLDEEINRQTNGEQSLDDVLKFLFQKGISLNSSQLLNGIKSVTGKDFSQIINDYLIDKKPLPFVRNGNDLVVDVEIISP